MTTNSEKSNDWKSKYDYDPEWLSKKSEWYQQQYLSQNPSQTEMDDYIDDIREQIKETQEPINPTINPMNTSNTNQSLSQAQVNIALASCEFFLKENNAGKVFANLRIPGEVQIKHPLFVGEILRRLEQFEGAEIIWGDRPRHGWYAIQFTSTLNHYISLAGVPGSPGRCLPSNLNIHRINTVRSLQRLVERRNQLMKHLVPPIVPLNTPPVVFPIIPNPWELPVEFHMSLAMERGSGRLVPLEKETLLLPPVKEALLLPPVKATLKAPPIRPTATEESPVNQLGNPPVGWDLIVDQNPLVTEESPVVTLEELQLKTKAQIAAEYLPSWSQSKINRTLKADLILEAIRSLG